MHESDIQSFGDGIHALDTGLIRPGLAASHLLVRDGRAAFVDAGTSRSVPGLLAALAALGISREAVDYIFLTVHLDHAGGAGELMRALPNAVVVMHPRGAPHLVDPAKLEAGTRAVYGDRKYDELFGPLVPIPAARIRSLAEDEVLPLGAARLRVLATPGHALHHVAVHDDDAGAVFAGDAFGISYRAFDNSEGEPFVFPTTSPTQFDPEQSHASIERIRALAPGAVYLGHFGRVTGIERIADDLHSDLDRFVAIAAAAEGDSDAEEQMHRALIEHLSGRLAAHGPRIDPEVQELWLTMDVRLSAAGLASWLGRVARERKRGS